jgi:hypothetical protein
MGLDMYAYVASRKGQYSEFWAGGEFNKETGDYSNPKISKPREIAYWRKHPNLHGWMKQLWEEKGRPKSEDDDDTFNGIELELTREDIDQLELDIKEGNLPDTTGFFFGDPSDNEYYEADLEFVKQARVELFMGLKVFYNSSW